jgi:hypothetical protein
VDPAELDFRLMRSKAKPRISPAIPAALLLVFSSPVFAHAISMSFGDLTLDGAHGHYELRMPLYEIQHIQDPERTLLEQVGFSSGGREAKRLSQSCGPDSDRNFYVCKAEYEFDAPVDRLDVTCRLSAVSVPNHLHLLHVQMGALRDEAVFDLVYTHTSLRFHPPSRWELAMTEAAAGFARAIGGVVQALFLAALVLAARGRKELLALSGMFFAGQVVSVLVAPHMAWQPVPRFVEAATALTVAYLAVEILLLPHGGARWLVAAVLGAFHGLYFHLFLQSTGYSVAWVLAGAAAAEAIVIAVLALIFSRVGRLAAKLHPVQVSASALFLFGVAWFLMRLRN